MPVRGWNSINNLALQNNITVAVRQVDEQLKFTTFIEHHKELTQAVFTSVTKHTTPYTTRNWRRQSLRLSPNIQHHTPQGTDAGSLYVCHQTHNTHHTCTHTHTCLGITTNKPAQINMQSDFTILRYSAAKSKLLDLSTSLTHCHAWPVDGCSDH